MALHNAGFPVLIDDFGSGYSSLNTLKNLKFDTIKLDMNFLQGAGETKKRDAIIETVMGLVDAMGATAIVEGVETEEQFDLVTKFGPCRIQGYYFYRPMLIEDFEKVLGER